MEYKGYSYKLLPHGKWQIELGRDPSGKRLRISTLESETAVKKHIDELTRTARKSGDFWMKLPEPEQAKIVGVLVEVKEAGLDLPTVWKEHQTWQEERRRKGLLKSETYEKAVAEWKKQQISARVDALYIKESEAQLLKFGAGRLAEKISEILPEELERWIDSQTDRRTGEKWSDSTRRTVRGRFGGLWDVAKRKGWVEENIVDRMTRIADTVPDKKIYENETVIRLMAAALHLKEAQPVLAPFALGFWGCMRPEEIQSEGCDPNVKPFGWDDINLKHARINVRGEISKTAEQRVIRLQPNCVAWLALAQELGNELPTPNERKLMDACCDLIDLEEWIRDGLRKTCATHLRNHYKNEHDTTNDMGHLSRTLIRNYALLHVPEEVSKDYFDITPERVKAYMKTKHWADFLKAAAESFGKKQAKLAEERKKKEEESKKKKAEEDAKAKQPDGPAVA